MPTYGRDAQGNLWEDRGGGYGRQISAAEEAVMGQGAIQNFGESVLGSAKQALLGGASLFAPGQYDRELAQQALAPVNAEMAGRSEQRPYSTFAGQVVPAAAAAVAKIGRAHV